MTYYNKAEQFFLESFNIDQIFHTIERTDYLFLYYIRHCNDDSQEYTGVYLADLAKNMNLPVSIVSKAIKKLQDEGFVEWKMTPEKERTYVELTENAIELMNDEGMWLEKKYNLLLEHISEEDLETTVNTIKKIRRIVQESQEMEKPESPK